jgi:hypothetical protein
LPSRNPRSEFVWADISSLYHDLNHPYDFQPDS